MTLRTLVACASPLSSPNTVRDHLNAINCDNLGGGGVDRLIPYTQLKLSVIDPRVSIGIKNKVKSLTALSRVLKIENKSRVVRINLDLTNKEIT